MDYRVLHDRLVLKVDDAEEVSGMGIVLATTAGSNDRGVVVACGPGRTLETGNVIPMAVAPGDHVLFSQHAGQTIRICGETYLVMTEADLIGILED